MRLDRFTLRAQEAIQAAIEEFERGTILAIPRAWQGDPYRASAIRVCLFIGVTLYAWGAIWVLERWRGAAARRTASRIALP